MTNIKKKDKTVRVKCDHEDCGYSWDYGGEMRFPTCPSCRRHVRKPIDAKLARARQAAAEESATATKEETAAE